MKSKLTILLLIAGSIIVALLTGCVGINYDQTVVQDGVTNHIHWSANRWVWSTESYEATMNPTGGGTLKASKSNVDKDAISAVAEGFAKGAAQGIK